MSHVSKATTQVWTYTSEGPSPRHLFIYRRPEELFLHWSHRWPIVRHLVAMEISHHHSLPCSHPRSSFASLVILACHSFPGSLILGRQQLLAQDWSTFNPVWHFQSQKGPKKWFFRITILDWTSSAALHSHAQTSKVSSHCLISVTKK